MSCQVTNQTTLFLATRLILAASRVNQSLGFLTRCDTTRATQPQKMVSLEILDLGRRGIVLCSKNKGADQLHIYCAADLHLCFCICKKQFSHDAAHMTSTFRVMIIVTEKSLEMSH